MEKFEEIIDSFINGQRQQGKAMIKKLSLIERRELYFYMMENLNDSKLFNEITVIMITRNFK